MFDPSSTGEGKRALLPHPTAPDWTLLLRQVLFPEGDDPVWNEGDELPTSDIIPQCLSEST